MGSFFEVRLAAGLPGGADIATRMLDEVEALETQLTVYNDESEVSRLNASAHLGPVPVEPRLFDLLERAVAIGQATEGAFDVASGALSLAWGFTKGPKRVPTPDGLADAVARAGARHLQLDPVARTVAFDREGVVINLGAIGKGYAIDRAVELARGHWWPTASLVHGGQSSLYALGSPPGDLGGRWEVAVRDPFDAGHPLGTLRLRNRGMATSGDAFQRFEADGKVYGHIIDPRTGEPPSDGPASVTVLAPTAAEADALSTAFLLQGADWTARFLRSRPEVAALFVIRDDATAASRVVPLNLTDADWEPARSSRRPRGSRPGSVLPE
jgi:thiamine biosynthesis lipoprotein